MPTSRATVPTEHASRYLQQLCKHWAHKFDVDFDPHKGTIAYPGGGTRLEAEENMLRVEVTSDTSDSLRQWEKVVADHLRRFAFREELAFDWQQES